jgi:hypothetical protein
MDTKFILFDIGNAYKTIYINFLSILCKLRKIGCKDHFQLDKHAEPKSLQSYVSQRPKVDCHKEESEWKKTKN